MDKKYGASKSQEDRKNELDPDNGNFKAGKARRVASRKRRSEYGIGKKGRKAAAAAVAKEAAVDKLERLGDGASMFGEKQRKEKHKAQMAALKVGKKNEAGASMGKPDMSVPAEKLKYIQKKSGPSMYGKKHGSSMDASQDRSASMDDYSHEKKLKADGRYEAAHGKMANAKNDFDHAHALKKDAHYDAKGRHCIMKHMKGLK